MGTKTEKHKRRGPHVHDDRHNDKKKPNVHYGCSQVKHLVKEGGMVITDHSPIVRS